MHPYPYSSPARAQDRLSTVLCFTFAALTLAAFYLGGILSSYRAVAQTAGLLFLTVTVYIMARNRIPYYYTVEQEADGQTWDLVISRVKGKHRITMCRLAMRDIRLIERAEGETRKAVQKKYQNKTVHNYCPTLFPEQSLYLTFEDSNPYVTYSAIEQETQATRGEEIIIRIACDTTILAMLQEQLK